MHTIKSLEEHVACGSSWSYIYIQNNTNETTVQKREHVQLLRIAVNVLSSILTLMALAYS